MLVQFLLKKLWLTDLQGPNLRAAGVDYDVAAAHPSSYEDFDFIVPRKNSGDTYRRFCVRNAEVWESISIIKQALATQPVHTMQMFP